MAVSGGVRVGFWPDRRVTPYVVAGAGAGVSRPTVNAEFPDPVTNDARFIFFGGGIRVSLADRLSLVADGRLQGGSEGNDGTLVLLPLRIGLAWRF